MFIVTVLGICVIASVVAFIIINNKSYDGKITKDIVKSFYTDKKDSVNKITNVLSAIKNDIYIYIYPIDKDWYLVELPRV
jgi:chlorite dismutase